MSFFPPILRSYPGRHTAFNGLVSSSPPICDGSSDVHAPWGHLVTKVEKEPLLLPGGAQARSRGSPAAPHSTPLRRGHQQRLLSSTPGLEGGHLHLCDLAPEAASLLAPRLQSGHEAPGPRGGGVGQDALPRTDARQPSDRRGSQAGAVSGRQQRAPGWGPQAFPAVGEGSQVGDRDKPCVSWLGRGLAALQSSAARSHRRRSQAQATIRGQKALPEPSEAEPRPPAPGWTGVAKSSRPDARGTRRMCPLVP